MQYFCGSQSITRVLCNKEIWRFDYIHKIDSLNIEAIAIEKCRANLQNLPNNNNNRLNDRDLHHVNRLRLLQEKSTGLFITK